MKEEDIVFSVPSPAAKESSIEIKINKFSDGDYLYKFIIGYDGVWDTLKDFSEEDTATWIPQEEGKYIIMLQAKHKDSKKPFDHVVRLDYVIGKIEEKIIEEVLVDKNELKVGDKIRLEVISSKIPVLYKYWMKKEDKWQLVKDYSAENTLALTVDNSGKQEIMVECRQLDSKNSFDDFKIIDLNVQPIGEIAVTDFKCLSNNMLVDEELVFQVDAKYDEDRMVLFKFVKLDESGRTECVQDYSNKRIVSYVEKKAGRYKLLCMVKDMYSKKHYDDRAVIDYGVKPYNPIEIQSFTTDLMSPQITDSSIQFKAVVKGGRKLLYRYIIEGEAPEDSGYINYNYYIWNPKKHGNYKVTLWVKDESFEGKYEKQAIIDYVIDRYSANMVKISEVVMSKDNDILVGEEINIKAIATGGINLRYSFILYKDGNQIEEVKYGICSWVNIVPEEEGHYELDIRVKDKYSTKEYDAHEIIHIDVKAYISAAIDYILMPSQENYLVGDNIKFDTIIRRTKDVLMRYVLKINGHLVEDTDYVQSKKYFLQPKCSGVYTLEIMAKSKSSSAIFDDKRVVKLDVKEAMPISNTKILWDKININVNEPVMFSVSCEGGKDVCYEFYLMEQSQWNLVQSYSKMNYYSFVPYRTGNYKVLALVKSLYNKNAYEDYDIMEFNVN